MEITNKLILEELREFRKENNERWDENDKRWDENDKRWDENNKRWEDNDKKWDEYSHVRIKDRSEIMETLDRMEKSISEQFEDLKVERNANDIRYSKMEKTIIQNHRRLDRQGLRIDSLESWKEGLGGEFVLAN